MNSSHLRQHGESSANGSATYRPDIDGLRAVSVIAVILFHAGVPAVTGGYVGVDVFFVISGYLITRLLIERPERSLRSQLAEFYVRRARRILPALLVVMWVTAIAAWLMYTPRALIQFGRSLAWCATMLGNVAAWEAGGYFDTPWASTPLLHLWSVAVEEQFYLFYPILLLLCLRLLPRRWAVRLVVVGTAGSLALCVWASLRHPAANYYAAPARAWELSFGALLALGAVPSITSRVLSQVLAALALLVIFATALVYDSSTLYPGVNTIAPALAAAALIVTGCGTPASVNRWLAAPPLVFTGLISYSLYLWHVPVLILSAYYRIEPLGPSLKLGLILIIALLSVASWALIERPIRSRRRLSSNALFLAIALLCSAITAAAGWWLSRSDGIPRRFPPEIQHLLSDGEFFAQGGADCMGMDARKIEAGALCRLGAQGPARSTVLLWGDSHSWALLPALDAAARRRGARVYFAAKSTCRPLLGVRSGFLSQQAEDACAAFNRAMTLAVQKLHPDVVMLDAYWSLGGTALIPDPQLRISPADSGFSRGLQETVRQIGSAARRVCVVQGVPILKYDLPQAFLMTRLRGIDDKFLGLNHAEAFQQQQFVDREIHELDRRGLLSAVDPKDVLCSAERCLVQAADGAPLYRDTNHLSLAGAALVAPLLERCIE